MSKTRFFSSVPNKELLRKRSLQQWEAILSKQQPSPSAYVNATSSVVSVTDEDFITNESIPQTAQRVSPAVAFGIKRLKQISFPTPLLSQYNAQLHSESSDEISQLKQDSKSFLEMLNSTSSPTRKRNILPYNLTYGPRETKAYLSTRFPVAYAVIRGILEELYNRLPPTQEIKSIVDFGSKCGATVIAAEEVWKTEKNYRLIEESPSMQKQIQQFTSDEQIFSTSSKLKFHAKLDVDEIKRADLVVANFSIQELPEKIRRQHVLKLWDLVYENNGILVVVERGTVFGASVIQQTREWILEKIKTGSSEGFILAPCAHEEVCPMMSALKLNERLKQEIEKKEKMDGKKSNLVDEDSLWVDDSDEVVEKKEEKREKKTAAVTKGKMKAWCHFPQKVQLPSATMKILGLKDNTLETTYSYIIFQKGKRPPGSESEDFHAFVTESKNWSRIVSSPLKRDGHVVFDVCGNSGNIERSIITKTLSKKTENKTIYREARKAKWGDLWPYEHFGTVVYKNFEGNSTVKKDSESD